MTKKVKSLNELTDSRILYEKDCPPFGYLIVSLISVLLISVLIWSIKTPKTYIVKSNGIIESVNKNYIMSAYSGEINNMYIEEGSYVEKGDLLFTVKSTDLNLQDEQLSGQIEMYEKTIEYLKKLEKSIMDGKNYFNSEVEEERQYYNQYEAYMSQIKQNDIDASTYKNYGYTQQQIEMELEKNSAKVSEIYYSTLKSVDESISQYKTEIDKLFIQQKAISEGKSEYQVFANASGIVHMSGDYKSGMVVQAANALGSIANENDEYIVTAYLASSDMPRVSIGDSVNIEVSGLAQNIYGNISGKLVSIDNDLTTSEDGKQSFFKSHISVDKYYLISQKGNKVNISNGMTVEARIIYDELSYFDYFLESIGILMRE